MASPLLQGGLKTRRLGDKVAWRQGGLEIPIKVSVTWDCLEKLSILEAKVKDV